MFRGFLDQATASALRGGMEGTIAFWQWQAAHSIILSASDLSRFPILGNRTHGSVT